MHYGLPPKDARVLAYQCAARFNVNFFSANGPLILLLVKIGFLVLFFKIQYSLYENQKSLAGATSLMQNLSQFH